MTDEEFKAELTLFAGQVEQKNARGILVDVSRFRNKPGPDVQPWLVKNISNRYGAVGRRAICLSVADPVDDESVIAGREFSHPSVHQQDASSCGLEVSSKR